MSARESLNIVMGAALTLAAEFKADGKTAEYNEIIDAIAEVSVGLVLADIRAEAS